MTGTIHKRIAISLMALLVLGFSLGSLVNFHLNRIYGNPLETELLFVKKDEKAIDDNTTLPSGLLTDGITPDFIGIPECSVQQIFLNNSRYILPYITAQPGAGSGLRAPPLA